MSLKKLRNTHIKKRGQNSIYPPLRSSTTLQPDKRVKPTPYT